MDFLIFFLLWLNNIPVIFSKFFGSFIEKTEKFPIGEPKNLEKITRILFNQRRKKIRKPINYIFKNNMKILNELNINLDLRPQNLDIQTYCDLVSKYEEKN